MAAIKTLPQDNVHPDLDYELHSYVLESPQTKVSDKPRYKIDLASQQAECEANFHRLLKLLPELETRNEWVFEIGVGPVSGEMLVRIIDRAPYTTTLQILQQEASNLWAKAPALTVCLYHDVNMAEVVAWENHRRLRPRYEYPNPDMYHSDEKAQLNQFLREWLTLCQCHGRSAIDMSELGL
jgi:uncharacterized protein YqiB (DUF1249 family)